MFLSFCIQVLSFLSKVVEMALWLWLGQGTESLRFSLNNPSNIGHCSNKNDREREREREKEKKREKEKEREKESARVGCQMIW